MAMMLAYCGLDCAECDARKATIADDDTLRAATAARWSKEFGFPCTPEMVNCTGCKEPGAKISHCAECQMRTCGIARRVANCGLCPEYAACTTVGEFLKSVPSAKANLDAAGA